MSYVATEWVAHETKVTAAAMNNIESGIVANETAITGLGTSKLNANQGAGNAGKGMIIDNNGALSPEYVVLKDQGVANAGKAMFVDNNGLVGPASIEPLWTTVSSTSASLNSDISLVTSESDSWSMCYNSQLKIFSFDAYLTADDDLTGTINVANLPVSVLEDGVIVENDQGLTSILYDGKLKVMSDWSSGVSVRFHVLCRYYPS